MGATKFLPVMLLAILLLSGCISSESSTPAVGVVDIARVFRDSEPGKTGVKFLEGLHEKMQGDLNAIEKDLQKKPGDQAMQQKLQETYMAFQQRMGAEQQNVVTLLNDAAQRAMDAARAQKKLSMIIGGEAALSFDKSVDVTADVIAELNKQTVEFKPVQPEEAAPAKQEGAAPTEKKEAPGAAPKK